MDLPWELNPQPCALLTQCSTTEPQEQMKIQILQECLAPMVWTWSLWDAGGVNEAWERVVSEGVDAAASVLPDPAVISIFGLVFSTFLSL